MAHRFQDQARLALGPPDGRSPQAAKRPPNRVAGDKRIKGIKGGMFAFISNA